jgi:signal transduction histidine kinase
MGRAPAGRLQFSVVDTGGTGITPEDLPHAFGRFYKTVDSTRSGLGLAISRSLVLAHGGKIGAESAPRHGMTIRSAFPLEPTEQPSAAA